MPPAINLYAFSVMPVRYVKAKHHVEAYNMNVRDEISLWEHHYTCRILTMDQLDCQTSVPSYSLYNIFVFVSPGSTSHISNNDISKGDILNLPFLELV